LLLVAVQALEVEINTNLPFEMRVVWQM